MAAEIEREFISLRTREALAKRKQDGKILHFGASVESVDEAMVCMTQEDLASLQNHLQYLQAETD